MNYFFITVLIHLPNFSQLALAFPDSLCLFGTAPHVVTLLELRKLALFFLHFHIVLFDLFFLLRFSDRSLPGRGQNSSAHVALADLPASIANPKLFFISGFVEIL